MTSTLTRVRQTQVLSIGAGVGLHGVVTQTPDLLLSTSGEVGIKCASGVYVIHPVFLSLTYHENRGLASI